LVLCHWQRMFLCHWLISLSVSFRCLSPAILPCPYFCRYFDRLFCLGPLSGLDLNWCFGLDGCITRDMLVLVVVYSVPAGGMKAQRLCDLCWQSLGNVMRV
jgi:hypothetical protein